MDAHPVVPGPVLVIGAGLVGSSLGMALTRAGVDVSLEDLSKSHALVAASLGAGRVSTTGSADVTVAVVVVATPPSTIADVVCRALERFPDAVVTDVGSVKGPIAEDVAERSPHFARYVPSHPMAGSQFTGPMTASADLFRDRTWVITPSAGNTEDSIDVVRALARLTGAVVVELDADLHDEAVAQVSHVPHLMSILTASHLRGVPGENLRLAGQGIRDVTRIAGSDPGLWRQILTTNAVAVREELLEVADDLAYLIRVLDHPDELEAFLRIGQHGAQSLLGKHGQEPKDVVSVTVEIPDEPRALGSLFGDVGDFGFNVEDFELNHDAVREVGYLSISVERPQAEQLRANLVGRGWKAWSHAGE
ncbi:MAG: prephenate dehydrogenase [Arachnia sp.]